MLTIGLTGGIGSGKSAVTDILQGLGVPVIDADRVAREVVAPGEAALEAISNHFGASVLSDDGSLDRRALRAIVFRDPEARHTLETILHPLIRQRMRQQLDRLSAPYAVLAIPLLVETGQTDSVDRVLVVDCEPSVQIQRICARDKITGDQARAILEAQVDRETRLAVADDIIDNSGTLEQLEPRVLAVHHRYLDLSR